MFWAQYRVVKHSDKDRIRTDIEDKWEEELKLLVLYQELTDNYYVWLKNSNFSLALTSDAQIYSKKKENIILGCEIMKC